jgi:DNA-binding CsgD family transcriptional regulator
MFDQLRTSSTGGTMTQEEGVEPRLWVRMVAPVLERLDECILLVEPPSPPCYRNLAARRLFDSHDEGSSLEEAIRRVATAAFDATRHAATETSEVRAAAAQFRLRAHTVHPPQRDDTDGPAILVVVEPLVLPLPRREALMRRFGLTAREAEVGLLLAQGLRNSAIALALALSPNTVRHYTESVMVKLGVHTRAAVARALLALASAPTRG